jgi:hypothetical protein
MLQHSRRGALLLQGAPVHHEFAIDAVQDGLQVVPLPRVLAVKQLQYPHDKGLHHETGRLWTARATVMRLHSHAGLHQAAGWPASPCMGLEIDDVWTLTATWSMYFFAAFASVSWHTTYRSRNSYTICWSNVPAISVQHVIPCDLA